MSNLKTTVDQVMGRIAAVKGRGEETTKQALILPIITALGYDIYNPDEVRPEYGADFVLQKRNGQQEKVDYAILLNGEPRIFIEAKALDVSLDDPSAPGQLSRYFNSTPTVTLGILTNGLEWRFYTDCTAPNMMDTRPFHIAKFDSLDQGLEVFDYFMKSAFNHESIRKLATDILFTAKIAEILRRELDLQDRDPSEALVRWVLSQEEIHTETRVTAAVVERFRPIVKNGLTSVTRSIVRRSLSAMDSAAAERVIPASPPAIAEPLQAAPAAAAAQGENGIITTENELKGFAIMKQVFDANFAGATVFDPSLRKEDSARLEYKDTSAYFGVYLNKPAWWVARLICEQKTKWIGFNLEGEKIEKAKALIPAGFTQLEASSTANLRVQINSIEDLKAMSELIKFALAATIDTLKR